MKTAVITGPTGSIGRSLIDLCISRGYEVLAIVHRTSPRAEELKKIAHCQVLYLDMDEYESGMDALSRQSQAFSPELRNLIFRSSSNNTFCDSESEACSGNAQSPEQASSGDSCLFFHLAWMAPFGPDRNNLELQLKNVQYSLSAVSLAKKLGCSCFIGAGSQAEYGRVSVPLAPDTPAFPETGYGIAKLCAGQMTRLACEQAGLKHVWCRILSVFGPHDNPKSIISTALNDMLNDRETSFTPCDQMWDFMYSDDAARALLAAAEHAIAADTYDIQSPVEMNTAGDASTPAINNTANSSTYVVGSGTARPLKDYIKTIADITGYTRDIGFGKRPYNDKQVMFLQADPASLSDIGFRPSISFEEGIRRMIDSITHSS
ncbi:MAG: NAD-dependent epimerase/dehydratase [Lachnospiraceae bacterium]|nr:NAD-dependent epimerase/dehydratase [Lachnospiraceae bacterium]